jgi:hypothetical protein
MKIRVINQELSNFNHDYKVKNINYDMVVALENNEAIPFAMDDIELIAENKYDDLILEYKDILKIKLGNNISAALYAALIDCIEEKIGEKLKAMDVLSDRYSSNRRGIWEKKLVVVVNHYIPLDITVVGEKYAEKFSITFRDITLQSFIEGCSESIIHIKKEIEEKENDIKAYKRAMDEVLKNTISVMDKKSKKLASGQ